jgi:RNA polymerase sigma-70 factor, ECF subfamily
VLHHETDADEVLHDVFLQLGQHAERYLPEKGLQGFLVTVARRRALDRLRRTLVYRRATDRFEADLKAQLHDRLRSAPRAFTTLDLADVLKPMIGQLPPAQPEVVQLTFYQGLSQREIASQKSIALGTVKTRRHLAQKKLLNQLTAVEGKF